MPFEQSDEANHRLRNALAALLANAQLLESTFAGETADRPLLAERSTDTREQALVALRNVLEASQRLADLLTKP